jgi:hypothetical protein
MALTRIAGLANHGGMTTNIVGELILDSLMPDYDVAPAEHVVVSADPANTWRAARELDLLTVHSSLLDAAMWIRGLPARLVGRVWRPIITWRDVTRGEFAGFDEPGWGKIAANFVVTPHGTRTLLSYECRTATTDSVARRRFRRYWGVVRSVVAHIMRTTLRTIKDDAVRAWVAALGKDATLFKSN